jgi:hypothetical protein
MRRSAIALFALALFTPAGAAAEQLTIVDVQYEHSATTTSDSHYRIDPSAQTPPDLTGPIDYADGSVHLRLEVLTKPDGGAPTKFQVCFEATPTYACTDQSPTYTNVGTIEWDSPFSRFWSPGQVDWSQGLGRVAIILKDDANNKPAGDPRYMPSQVHLTLTLVSAGSTYERMPAEVDAGVSVVDAGSAIPSDAGAMAGVDAGPSRPHSGAATLPRDAGMNIGTDAALGSPPNLPSAASLSGQTCSSSTAGPSGWLPLVFVLMTFARGSRRRRVSSRVQIGVTPRG